MRNSTYQSSRADKETDSIGAGEQHEQEDVEDKVHDRGSDIAEEFAGTVQYEPDELLQRDVLPCIIEVKPSPAETGQGVQGAESQGKAAADGRTCDALFEHDYQDKIQNDIQKLGGDIDDHAGVLLAAIAQEVIGCKIDGNQRGKERIDLQIGNAKCDDMGAGSWCQQHDEGAGEEIAPKACKTGKG